MISILGITDFSKSGDFNPGTGIYENHGILFFFGNFPQIMIFSCDEISHQKANTLNAS